MRDPSKLFCPDCGNDSLLKVSCSVVSDGTIILYRKRNFTVNNRGSQVFFQIYLNLVFYPQIESTKTWIVDCSWGSTPYGWCEAENQARGIIIWNPLATSIW